MSSKSTAGNACAYFVAAELSQRDYTAAIASRTLMIDVLASSPDGLKTVSIQVTAGCPEQRKNFRSKLVDAGKT